MQEKKKECGVKWFATLGKCNCITKLQVSSYLCCDYYVPCIHYQLHIDNLKKMESRYANCGTEVSILAELYTWLFSRKQKYIYLYIFAWAQRHWLWKREKTTKRRSLNGSCKAMTIIFFHIQFLLIRKQTHFSCLRI